MGLPINHEQYLYHHPEAELNPGTFRAKYQAAGTFRAADSAGRKQFPLFSGLLAYFPDALADVARISYIGNDKHNPGEPLHWSRPKSNDHMDCAARHLVQAQWEDDEEDHLGEAIWRLLAEKQMRIEAKRKVSPPKNAVD